MSSGLLLIFFAQVHHELTHQPVHLLVPPYELTAIQLVVLCPSSTDGACLKTMETNLTPNGLLRYTLNISWVQKWIQKTL